MVADANSSPTMGTDGEILYYNPDFVAGLTDRQLLGVMAHETLHCALGHLWRRDNRDPWRWNMACDYAVNKVVLDNNFELPPGCLVSNKYNNLPAEKIYDQLKPQSGRCPLCNQQKQQQEEGEGQSQADQPSKSGKPSPSQKKPSSSPKTWQQMTPTERAQAAHHHWHGADKKPNRQAVERKWQAAVSEAIKTRGHVPAGLERLVEEMQPKEDWRQILANFLSSSATDFDFMRRDRRTLEEDFYLPDLNDEEQLDNLVIAIDTSGSIGQTTLATFLTEIKNLVKTFPKTRGWVMECDADIGAVTELEKINTKKSFTGGGGTSHVPVFAEINKRQLKPRVVICLTDLYTEFPSYKPDYPVLWLVPEADWGYGGSVPFGRVVKLKKHDH